MKKFIKILLTFGVVLTLTSIANQAHADENNNYDSDIERIYQQGKDKGIITNGNMPYEQFSNLMKESLIPVYENNKQNNPDFNKSLDEFVSDDNYELDPQEFGKNSIKKLNYVDPDNENSGDYVPIQPSAAKRNYKMKAGDILICYGSDPMGSMAGHAAIAYSNSEVLHMPGPGKHAQKWSKSKFFKKYAKSNYVYVKVYRKNNENDGKKAANYAYNHMYKGTNPSYWLQPVLSDQNHSYCSKYVFLAYANSNYKTIDGGYAASHAFSLLNPHNLSSGFTSIKNIGTIASY